MLRLGPYTLPNRYLLAPMAGVSEMPFRCIALELGAALATTELVSAAGLMRASKRTLKYITHDPAIERPFSVQIFGGDPHEMAEAAAVAKEQGAHIIDINMGCPVPKVTKNGAGSGLLCDPARGARIVSAIAARTGLPVTVKIRAGWDAHTINAPEVARILADAGAVAVALHPRTRAQSYSGKADWSLIARVRDAVPAHVAVIGNGDVHTREDAERMTRETACDAVMIGRAALGNPWLFRVMLGGPPPTVQERHDVVLRHYDAQAAFVGQAFYAMRAFRKTLGWYTHALQGASAFRAAVMRNDDPVDVRARIDAFFSTAQRAAGQREDEVDDGIDYRQAYG